jgi:hypothetical protein
VETHINEFLTLSLVALLDAQEKKILKIETPKPKNLKFSTKKQLSEHYW